MSGSEIWIEEGEDEGEDGGGSKREGAPHAEEVRTEEEDSFRDEGD